LSPQQWITCCGSPRPPLRRPMKLIAVVGYISLCAQIAENATIDLFGPTPPGAA
jgi:hypothetical protein